MKPLFHIDIINISIPTMQNLLLMIATKNKCSIRNLFQIIN